MTFLYRPQRGSLEESMKEVVELIDKEALAEHLDEDVDRITVRRYAWDNRINWDTYLVCVDGHAWGYTNGSVDDEKRW